MDGKNTLEGIESKSPAQIMGRKFMLNNLDKYQNDASKFTTQIKGSLMESIKGDFNHTTKSVTANTLTKENFSKPTEEKPEANLKDKGVADILHSVIKS